MESRIALARKSEAAEDRAEVAESKIARMATFYKNQASRKEEIGDIVLSGAATVTSGIMVHGIRRAVNLEVYGIDLGGVTALGMFLTAGLGGGGKYARLIGASGAGVGLEYAIHKMDKPAADTDAAGVDDETGDAAPAPKRKRVTQLLKPARRGRPPLYGPNVRTIDVDFEEVPIGAPGYGQRGR